MFKIAQRIGNDQRIRIVQRIPKTCDSFLRGGVTGAEQCCRFSRNIAQVALENSLIFTIKKYINRIKVSEKRILLILKKNFTGAEGALSTLTALHLPEMMMQKVLPVSPAVTTGRPASTTCKVTSRASALTIAASISFAKCVLHSRVYTMHHQ